jgi:transposase
VSASKRPEKKVVADAIRAAGGNLSRAAEGLGCSRQTLYTWIFQLDLTRLAGVVPREAEQLKRSVREAGKQPLTVKVDAALHRWIRVRAILTDQTVSEVVEEALALTRAVAEAQERDGAPEVR